MTNYIEEQLSAGMGERVAGITLTTDLVGPTLRRQRRRTMIMRTSYALGVVGLTGALGVGVIATGRIGPATTPDRPPAAGAESPKLRLAAAIATSQGTSYRVKNAVRVRSTPGSPPLVIEGAFDPAKATGYLRIPFDNGSYEERLVDGDLYIGDSGTGRGMVWRHDPGKHSTLAYDVKSGLLAMSADPQQLFDALTQSGATISQTGPDKYHFEVAVPARKGLTGGDMVGDVTIGSDNRVAKVVYKATLNSAGGQDVLDGTLELSGYGNPVKVERPGGTFEQLPVK